MGKDADLPVYKAVKPEVTQKMLVHESVSTRMYFNTYSLKKVQSVRPVVVCAILRGLKFNADSYKSFIDLQEKLHHNICRRRTLASIGTHDLDSIEGPFSYEAIPPSDFKFIPLRQTVEVDGHGMMELLEKVFSLTNGTNGSQDEHLKDFLHLIRDKPAYPVILDAKRRVLSVPPIINGEHSKITLDTRNVLIEVTGIDKTKVSIVLDMVCTMFSVYCEDKFVVEQVEVAGASGKFLLLYKLIIYCRSCTHP